MFRNRILTGVLAIALAALPLFAKSTTWISTTSNDLNKASNWSNGEPEAGDNARFTKKKDTVTSLKATGNFTPSTMKFLNCASCFRFLFKDCSLIFTDNHSGNAGIFGECTNTELKILNKNNTLASQLSLEGHTSNTTGSASILIKNTKGLITGNQVDASSAYTMDKCGSLVVVNKGNDTSGGTGNVIGSVAGSQLSFADGYTSGDSASLCVSNRGVYQGKGSNNHIGDVNGSQFVASGALEIGNCSEIHVSNFGRLDGNGDSNFVGNVNGSQFQTDDSFTGGNHVSVAIINKGDFNGDGMSSAIGYVNQQFQSNAFSIGDDSSVCIKNSGGYSGDGNFTFSGYVNNAQLLNNEDFTAGDHYNLKLGNIGKYAGNGTTNSVGYVNGQQFSTTSFTAGQNARLCLWNIGRYKGDGSSNQAGYAGSQFQADVFNLSRCSLLALSNFGKYKGDGSTNEVGFIDGPQFSATYAAFGDLCDIVVRNTGIDSGDGSTNSIGYVGGPQFGPQIGTIIGNSTSSSFSFEDQAKIIVSNTGQYDGGGSGNQVGYVGGSQIGSQIGPQPGPQFVNFTSSLSFGDQAYLAVSNDGHYDGGGSMNQVGYVGGSQIGTQIGSTGPAVINNRTSFSFGDKAYLAVSNNGQYDGGGSMNQVGYVSGSQIGTQIGKQELTDVTSFSIGDKARIAVSNSGQYDGNGNTNNVGFIAGNQIAAQTFSIKDKAKIAVTNSGQYEGDGTNQVGEAGNQIDIAENMSVGNKAHIAVSNSGQYDGDGTGNHVGFVQLQITGQLFSFGDKARIAVANSGQYDGSGSDNNVGIPISGQISISTFTVGDKARIAVSNSGQYDGNGTGNFVGSPLPGQITIPTFTAGDKARIAISNLGKYVGNGSSNFVGSPLPGQFNCATFTAGDKARIAVSNSGQYDGNGIGNQVGCPLDAQIIHQTFTAGDKARIAVSNSGQSSGDGTNFVGCALGGQIISPTFTAGNKAEISFSNSGQYDGGGSGNLIGCATAGQIISRTFSAGNKAEISLSNSGQYDGDGTANQVGIAGHQINIADSMIVGNNAKICLSNFGQYDGNGTANQVGNILSSQFASGNFIAGKKLFLFASNRRKSSNVSNQSGFVGVSQILFNSSCTIGNGSVISAYNNGLIGSNQIHFVTGFTITGKATIQAVNDSSIAVPGIVVDSSAGGDANIVLQNSSLIINSTASQFTIGELNGDSSSFVNCVNALVINTDPDVFADFEGNIQKATGLIKTGVGTQKLSGKNTFAAPTTIKQGILNLTGSLLNNVTVFGNGTLAGTGTIGGTVKNFGTISPGESIGTLTMGSFVNNNGIYDVEVNGLGDSDLIKVQKQAILNGGKVVVSSSDCTYKFKSPYTILTAGRVINEFSDAVAVSPMIKPELSYRATNVLLTLTTEICLAAKTPIERTIAGLLDGIISPNAKQNLLLSEIVNLSLNQAQKALESLAGNQYTNTALFADAANRQFIRRLYDPLRFIAANCYRPCCGSTLAWVEGGGQFSSLKHGFNSRGYEITAGAHATLGNHFTCGVAGSYENDTLHFHNHGGSSDCCNWFVGLYSIFRPSCFYGIVDLAYGHNEHRLDRQIQIGNARYHAHSKPSVSKVTFYGEAGFDLINSCVAVQPFAAVEAGGYCQHRIHEHKVHGWELNVVKRVSTVVSPRLGLHLTACRLPGNIAVSADAAWSYRNFSNHVTEQFVEFGDRFRLDGVKLNNNSVDYALTLSKCAAGFRFYVEGTGENWNHANNYTVLAGIQRMW